MADYGRDKAKSCQYFCSYFGAGHAYSSSVYRTDLLCVCAGRAQMVQEQSRLEKLLLQQQREIQTLQRTYAITKAGMCVSSPSRHFAINVNVLATCLAPHLHKLWSIKWLPSSPHATRSFNEVNLHEQSMKKNPPRCYIKSPTVQDAFWPVPGLI